MPAPFHSLYFIKSDQTTAILLAETLNLSSDNIYILSLTLGLIVQCIKHFTCRPAWKNTSRSTHLWGLRSLNYSATYYTILLHDYRLCYLAYGNVYRQRTQITVYPRAQELSSHVQFQLKALRSSFIEDNNSTLPMDEICSMEIEMLSKCMAHSKATLYIPRYALSTGSLNELRSGLRAEVSQRNEVAVHFTKVAKECGRRISP